MRRNGKKLHPAAFAAYLWKAIKRWAIESLADGNCRKYRALSLANLCSPLRR